MRTIAYSLIRRSLQLNYGGLTNGISCLESQQSKLFTTVMSLESLKFEIRDHVYDLQREVQQLQQIHVQTDLLVSGTRSIDMKETLSKTVKGAAQSSEMGAIILDLNGRGRIDQQHSQTIPDSQCYRLNRTPSQMDHRELLEHSDPNGSMLVEPSTPRACRRTPVMRMEGAGGPAPGLQKPIS